MTVTQHTTRYLHIAVIWVLTAGLSCVGTMVFANSDAATRTAYPEEKRAALSRVGAANQAAKVRIHMVSQEFIVELIHWIGEHTSYDTSRTLADPPSVIFSDSGQNILYEGRHLALGSLFRAVYDVDARQIYLRQPWSFSNIFDRSTLLHELVHDVQYQNRTWLCAGKSEWQAYKLQEAWLSEHGVESGFNWVQILIQSRCPRDVHP